MRRPNFAGTKESGRLSTFLWAQINSCFMTTFLAIAENSKLEFVHFDSKATGKLEKHQDAGLMMTLVDSTAQSDN
jgi:organic hydroperoxide reductase OsmC/OhrA